jgi:superfamily II DNA or RNA helicase
MATSTLKNYFHANRTKFNLWGGLKNGKGLRECQLGAYWSVWSHFTTSDEPALVSLPTASGKTALMMALSFGFEAKRVLIITPARVLRDQTCSEFESLDVLKRSQVVGKNIQSPKVYSNDNKLRTKNDWLALTDYDVVTATPKTTSPAEDGVCSPPPDLFDLVFLDEAHHSPATTWAAILKAFKGTKCVLLTATPFRRDKRSIRAPLIYHYSIAKALESGIYRPVRYHAVKGSHNRLVRDKELCKAAKRILNRENKQGNNSKLLIRTDRVDWAGRLVTIYEKQGIKVGAVDYTRSWQDNEQTIEAVREDKLDGIVCVGMIGEGLDLPELKIAVLHSAPRSLPFTLQFVGRVSRFSRKQVGEAHLLSVPDEVRGEVRRLHRVDANWRKLVPELADEVIGKVTRVKPFSSSQSYTDLDINPDFLKPFYSVRVFRTDLEEIDLDVENLELPDNTEVCFCESSPDNAFISLITETADEPPWAKETSIIQTQLDLHIFYYHKRNKVLFEATTAEAIAKYVRKGLVKDKSYTTVDPDKIMRVMQKGEFANYFMVGLKNVAGSMAAQSSYKIMMGHYVQSAVRPTDGKTFAPGHALLQLSADETRGVATLKSRVWSIKRGTLNEFREWCDRLAIELRRVPDNPGLPQLSFLAGSQNVTELPEAPLAILLDESLFRAKTILEVSEPDALPMRNNITPEIKIKGFNQGTLACEFCFHTKAPSIQFSYQASDSKLWKKIDHRDVRIRVEFSDTDIFDGDLVEYLDEFPPRLLMPEGGVIINRQHWKPRQRPGPLPGNCIQALKWEGCDITKETGKAKPRHKNIHEWIGEKLKRETDKNAIIIFDDGPGEMADYIVVEHIPTKLISFYHCKGMHTKKGRRGKEEKREKKPTDSVGDAYEVLGQAIRCGRWILSRELMGELHKHAKPPRSAPIVKPKSGGLSQLKKLAEEFNCNDWQYQIVVIQPGFKSSKIEDSEKINPLLVATYEWIRSCSAEFAIWGS